MFQMGQETQEFDPNPPSVRSRYLVAWYIKQEEDLNWEDRKKRIKKENK